MAIGVPRAIMNTVCAARPETGGILLGPKDSDTITEFHFDAGGTWTGATYSPDVKTLNAKLRDEWKPRGLAVRGFAHSHPEHVLNLSAGDLVDIGQILQHNPAMPAFMAPIVIPDLFLIRPFIVYRGPRLVVREAMLDVFDPELAQEA